jgi:hypothetical protein
MTTTQNCWEFKQCGRQLGGARAWELGVCPAATDAASDGVNGGTNGGRICWAIAGTFCRDLLGVVESDSPRSCRNCMFFTKVGLEHGEEFHFRRPSAKHRNAASGTRSAA